MSSRSRSASAAAATSSPPRHPIGEAPTTRSLILNELSERLEPARNNPCREIFLTTIRPDQSSASAIRGDHIVAQGEMDYSQRGIRVSSQGETDDSAARIRSIADRLARAEGAVHYGDRQRRWTMQDAEKLFTYEVPEPDPIEKARVNKLADNSGGLFALVVEAEFNSTDPLIQGRITALRAAFSQLEKMLK